MTIQISGTTVIDQNRYIQNIQAYYGPGIASQAEAQAGTNNDQLMTPLRVKQSISTFSVSSATKRVQRGTSSYSGTSNSSVPIVAVNTGKSFVSCGYRSDPTNNGSGRLNNPNTILIAGGGSGSGILDWEVIEFN